MRTKKAFLLWKLVKMIDIVIYVELMPKMTDRIWKFKIISLFSIGLNRLNVKLESRSF